MRILTMIIQMGIMGENSSQGGYGEEREGERREAKRGPLKILALFTIMNIKAHLPWLKVFDHFSVHFGFVL